MVSTSETNEKSRIWKLDGSMIATVLRRPSLIAVAIAALLISTAPMVWAADPPARSALPADRDFDAGSGIEVTTLSEVQVDNLTLLGRIWGFLKYHHPRVTAGKLKWDEELFRVLPAVLEAADRDAGNHLLFLWVRELGPPKKGCDSAAPRPRRCAAAPENAHLLPDLDWLDDIERLGPELSDLLREIHRGRTARRSFYVSHDLSESNPIFKHEPAYPDLEPPDAGYRILALLRLWNIIEYWFPYRDLLDDEWSSVLAEFLPRMVAADDWDGYRLELLALAARVYDTHANLFAERDVLPPRGDCRWPVAMRFVEGHATVTALSDEAPDSGLVLGDVIETVDGREVEDLVDAWAPYYAASNDAARRRAIARFLPRGDCGDSRLGIVRRGEARTLTVARVEMDAVSDPHDRPGKTFQLLSEDVAYLKLSSIHVPNLRRYLRTAGSRDLVIDIRNYPGDFVPFALGEHLVEEPTPFVRFIVGDTANPGAFTWGRTMVLRPVSPTFPGRVAILIDEATWSQAEYTAMALRAGPRAVVVGSTTAGADGDVSQFPLPGGLQMLITGVGIFYPDGTPTQRIGIVPDIVATPTVEGISEGRDEVLEAALRLLLGPGADQAAIRRMAER